MQGSGACCGLALIGAFAVVAPAGEVPRHDMTPVQLFSPPVC